MSERRQKTEVIKVRVAAEELAILRARAENAGLPLSGFMRQSALRSTVRAANPDARKLWTNMGRIGGLLRLALTQVDQGNVPDGWRALLAQTLIEMRAAARHILTLTDL